VPPAPRPTETELALLQVLWNHGPLTVKEVHEIHGDTTGYTTTLKLLQLMTEKGLVVRNEERRAHVYRAKLREGATQRQLLVSLAERAFRGSTSRLVLQALASRRTTPEELAEIKRLVARLAKEKS
jgi:predicted transcriptional regulator